jgi:hypothetical protein
MAVKSKEQINQRKHSTDRGFGSVKPKPEKSDHNSTTPSDTANNISSTPELAANEAAAALATQTLENAANSLLARSYSRHQVVGQLQTLSSQLALQDAAEDYFVLSGAHYENEYRRNLAALASAEQAFQQEFNFQRSAGAICPALHSPPHGEG